MEAKLNTERKLLQEQLRKDMEEMEKEEEEAYERKVE